MVYYNGKNILFVMFSTGNLEYKEFSFTNVDGTALTFSNL